MLWSAVSHLGSNACGPNVVCQAVSRLSMRTMQEQTYIAYYSLLTKDRVLIQYMAHQALIPACTVRILDGISVQQH